ncbi:OTU domain-containing protein [Apostasia shenzhenica]|uniref:OTU domain-containing protein n=1 Tax=Apostasia shenzhenica TaxID=1088818 RepID=A0A2H9ZYW7_9ASPA|nr:OTU domain-containing protein [Apostasia shenzhenica]
MMLTYEAPSKIVLLNVFISQQEKKCSITVGCIDGFGESDRSSPMPFEVLVDLGNGLLKLTIIKTYVLPTSLGVPGDGRCLFRAVTHGACLRAGQPSPNERLQKELADELRNELALCGLAVFVTNAVFLLTFTPSDSHLLVLPGCR